MLRSSSTWILVAQRLAVAFVTLLIVSFAVFFATALLPGDVAEILLGQAATPEAVAGLRTAMGLDEPAFKRFLRWLGGLATGDMGRSYVNDIEIARPVSGRLANSLRLAAIVTVICVPVSLTLGIATAMWRRAWFDRGIAVMTISFISVPEFMVATLAVLIFAVWSGWLPALSYGVNADGLDAILRA